MNKNQWSDPLPWGPDRDPEALPHDIRQGDIIKSDQMIRIEHLASGKWDKQFYPNHIWVVQTGAAFQITPTLDPKCPSMVIHSFQIWGGTPEEFLQYKEEEPIITEQDLVDMYEN